MLRFKSTHIPLLELMDLKIKLVQHFSKSIPTITVYVMDYNNSICMCISTFYYSYSTVPQAVLRAATTEMDELVEKIGQHINVPVR